MILDATRLAVMAAGEAANSDSQNTNRNKPPEPHTHTNERNGNKRSLGDGGLELSAV